MEVMRASSAGNLVIGEIVRASQPMSFRTAHLIHLACPTGMASEYGTSSKSSYSRGRGGGSSKRARGRGKGKGGKKSPFPAADEW